MTPLELTTSQLDEFFGALTGMEHVFDANASLGYCAIRKGGTWLLYSARLRLGSLTPPKRRVFESETVRAGTLPLEELGLSPRGLVDHLLTDHKLPMPGSDVTFEPENGTYSPYLVPHHRMHEEREALTTLKLRGGRTWEMLDRDEIAWALRGHETPYESLDEVCSFFDAGTEASGLELTALTVAKVSPQSLVRDKTATLVLTLADGLSTNLCRLSYRVLSGQSVVTRSFVAGSELTWQRHELQLVAAKQIEVPAGALIDCAVSYDNKTHHHAWVVDRATVQNPRRSAFESSDKGLVALRRMLLEPQVSEKDGRAFESAVTWLLWMLGFSPAHLGNSKRLEEAPDLLVDIDGQFAVVECTIGQLRVDKLSTLNARVIAVRESLAVSGRRDGNVLPILVTQRTREEVEPDIPATDRASVLVLTRDELEPLLERTRLECAPQAMLDGWRQQVAAAQQLLARQQSGGGLD